MPLSFDLIANNVAATNYNVHSMPQIFHESDPRAQHIVRGPFNIRNNAGWWKIKEKGKIASGWEIAGSAYGKVLRDSRLWQLKSRRALALEHSVDEHAVLAIARHEEKWMFVINFEMPPRDKAGVAHVDVDLTLAAVTADRDAPLSNHILELATL